MLCLAATAGRLQAMGAGEGRQQKMEPEQRAAAAAGEASHEPGGG